MKTPEEIKKGLECCTIPLCGECPYDSEASCVVKNEDALAYIQQLEAKVPRWISVEERLPVEWQYVLAINKYDDDSFEPCIAYVRANEWFTGTFARGCEITHWMPLPEPPVEV